MSDLCVDESQRLRSLGRPSWLTMLEKTSQQCTTYSECALHVLVMSVGHFMVDICEPAFSARTDCPSDSWTQTVCCIRFTRTLIYIISKSCLPSTIGPFIGARLLLDSMTHHCDSTSNREGLWVFQALSTADKIYFRNLASVLIKRATVAQVNMASRLPHF